MRKGWKKEKGLQKRVECLEKKLEKYEKRRTG